MDLKYSKLKATIQAKVCPVHKERPVLTISDDSTDLYCCCAEFKADCLRKIAQLMSVQTKQNIEKYFTANIK